MYYIIDCEIPVSEGGGILMEIHNYFRVGKIRLWRRGQPFKYEVPAPILIDCEPFHSYKGPPMELFDVGIPLMSARLARVLTETGVNNIDFYEAILKNTETGETYNYKAYNVIGLVAADVIFNKLVVDEDKTHGLLMFRLAENINALMVHKEVRDRILSSGIDTLTFKKTEDWVQL